MSKKLARVLLRHVLAYAENAKIINHRKDGKLFKLKRLPLRKLVNYPYLNFLAGILNIKYMVQFG